MIPDYDPLVDLGSFFQMLPEVLFMYCSAVILVLLFSGETGGESFMHIMYLWFCLIEQKTKNSSRGIIKSNCNND